MELTKPGLYNGPIHSQDARPGEQTRFLFSHSAPRSAWDCGTAGSASLGTGGPLLGHLRIAGEWAARLGLAERACLPGATGITWAN